ncbi:MAG: siroheme synthase CysG [Acidobacteria bacterium]|nr:siroheme synthase CysG [Acidobacteriota bacterium]
MFPVMLQVHGRRCLVVGGGGVALRKVQALAAEGALVTVVAPDVVPAIERLAAEGAVELDLRRYSAGEAAGFRLVIAATDDREVNRRVFEDGDAAGVWVNVADDPELCSFHLPGRVRRGGLEVDVSSGGDAPFVVRRLRRLLETRLGPEWGEWLDAAGRFRRAVYSLDLTRSEQEKRFEKFFSETVDRQSLTARVPREDEVWAWLRMPGDDGKTATHDPAQVAAGLGQRRQAGAGFVSLVGGGPGAPGLLTVRARQRLEEADAVVFDRLAATVLPTDLACDVELHCVGKTAGHHPVPQEEISALLVRLARAGKRVVRLKGGDPYVFGRGGEEGETLAAAGIEFEVVPGVTSGIAGPAWAGIPVTHRREAVRVTLLTAHECSKSGGKQVRWDLLAKDRHATLVGYMGVSALPRLVERLVGHGMDAATPAAMIERATTSAQRTVISTLAELPVAAKRSGIRPPALFVIGSTVRHARALDWISHLPLAGERLVVPAAAEEMVRRLEEAGAEVVPLPVPVTPAARVVLDALPVTGCVFSSPADVDLVDDERDGAGWGHEVIAWCLGREAAERARNRGWQRIEELEGGLTDEELVRYIGRRRSQAA